MEILILYATRAGQTAKIAESIAELLRKRHHQVNTCPADALPANFHLERYQAAILGGSIYIGKYPKALRQFVRQHRDWLNSHPSAFYTVCMAINSQYPESQKAALNFSEQFFRETQWQPAETATFAGAVKYTKYGWLTRLIMKSISKREGGSTDTSQDHEYTDWHAVEHFTDQFAAKLAK